MIQIFPNPTYDFIGKRRWAYLASALALLICLASLVADGGLRQGIDFSGGSLVQLRFEEAPSIERLRAAFTRMGAGDGIIQQYGDSRDLIARLPLVDSVPGDVAGQVREALAADSALGPVRIDRVEFVGPQAGRDLQWQALQAVAWSILGILAYIAIRFDFKGGLAAVAALVHDVIVCLGALSLAGRELSLPVLAALLTIIGYSVNDTIVAYDRMRENRRTREPRAEPFAVAMNAALNQTLSRTVLTALTVFFTTLVLFLFGGPALEDFAFVLTVGVITGTYSTIYIAGSLIVDWTAWRERKQPTPRSESRPRLTALPGGRTRSQEGQGRAG